MDIKPASNAIAIVLTGRQSVFAARSTTIMDPLAVGYADANPLNPMYPTVAINAGFTGVKKSHVQLALKCPLFVGLHIFSVGCEKQLHSIPISTASYLPPDFGPRLCGQLRRHPNLVLFMGACTKAVPYVSSDQKTTIWLGCIGD